MTSPWTELYELPPIGLATPDEHQLFSNLRTRLAVEARNERGKWMPMRDACLDIFNYGEYPRPADAKVVMNHVQNDVIGDKDVMFHEPVAVEIAPEEDGSGVIAYYWNGPPQVPQPVIDPMTGEMAVDPNTGQPAMQMMAMGPPPVQDPISGEMVAQPIDEQTAQAMLASGTIQSDWIAAIDNKSLGDVYQLAFDRFWRKAYADEWVDQFTLTTLKAGWAHGLYQWDPQDGHILLNIPAQNAYPDPTKQFIWDWGHHQIHRVMRLETAQRQYPQFAKQLWEKSQQGQPKRVDAQTEMGYQYDRDFQSRTVTLSILWLKDQPVPMSPEEAVSGGHVQQNIPAPVPDIGGFGAIAGGGDAGDRTARAQDTSPLPSDGTEPSHPEDAGAYQPSATAPAQPVATNPEFSLPDGTPVAENSPQWPMRYVLRQIVQLDDILLEDEECPWPCIPGVHATAIPVEDSPYGFGLPWKMRHAQKSDSTMARAISKNCEYYGNPAHWMAQHVKDRMKSELQGAHIDPGVSMGLQPEEINQNGKPLAGFFEIPQMNEHHIEGRVQMQNDRKELGGYTDAARGIPVTADPSGELQKVTMQAASGIIASISKHLQGSFKHLSNLMLHSLIHYATVKQINECCKKYRREVLAAIHLNHAPNTCWKVDVLLSSGAGSIREHKRQEMFELNQKTDPASGLPLVDGETVQEQFNLDPETVKQRNLKAAQQGMMLQAAMAPAEGQDGGGKNKKPGGGGSSNGNGNGHKSRMNGE